MTELDELVNTLLRHFPKHEYSEKNKFKHTWRYQTNIRDDVYFELTDLNDIYPIKNRDPLEGKYYWIILHAYGEQYKGKVLGEKILNEKKTKKIMKYMIEHARKKRAMSKDNDLEGRSMKLQLLETMNFDETFRF